MFAALNSIEPHIQNLTAIDLFHAQEDWAKQRRPAALTMAQTRLATAKFSPAYFYLLISA